MTQVKAWKAGAPGEPSFPDDFEVVTKVVLQVTDLKTNHNKYYGMELHRSGKRFRVFTHYGRTDDLDKKPTAGVRESRYYATLEDAQAGYDDLYAEKTGPKKGYQEVQLTSSRIGSQQARAADPVMAPIVIVKASGKPSLLHPGVQALVRAVFAEATTALTTTVSAQITAKGIETPLGVLTMGQIQKGDAILEQLYAEFHKGAKRPAELTRLSGEFYTVIPHRLGRTRAAIDAAVINTMTAFEEKQETLQLMKDMLTVNAAGGNVLFEDDVDARAKALGCELAYVEHGNPTFRELADLVVTSQRTSKRVKVAHIYTVKRPGEWEAFQTKLEPQQLLFHGSRFKNWTGILSRGLLMPKVVVQMGVDRTDEGWLGNGIYFGDAACTSAFYAAPGKGGTRLMAVARVALGEMKEYTKMSYGLTAPPPGYHSCHGLRSRPGLRSQFTDDEYVVYRNDQQRLEYLVEFTA